MSASPRKKTFPTLHTAMDCTAPPAATKPIRTTSPNNNADFSSPRKSSSSNNAPPPPTVPYTMGDMTAGMNHIISTALTANHNHSTSTPTKDCSMAQYLSPSKRLFKGLTTTCDGSYGQQLLPTMDAVPVEDVMRWKEFRRKQKTVVAAAATEIDVHGFLLSDEDDDDDDGADDTIIPKQQTLVVASSEVGTEIASNTARYLAKQSNIMARQLMMSSTEEGRGGGKDNDDGGDDDDDDWDVGDGWCSPLDVVVGGQDDEIRKMSQVDEDCEIMANDNINAGSHVNYEGSQQSPSLLAASPSKNDVPTIDEVYHFMNQLKQKSAAGRVTSKYYSKSIDNTTTINSNNNNNKNSNMSSSPPKSTPQRKPPTINSGSYTKTLTTTTTAAASTSVTSSGSELQKSLIEHRERMKQQKLEGQRKRQEFDARLQLLRSKLHSEAVDADGNSCDDDNDDGLIAPTMEGDSICVASPRTEQGEKEVKENNEQKSMPILPGARWSGGLAVWNPSNGVGGGDSGGSSAAKRSKSTPPKLSSPSRQNDTFPHPQPQQQQQQTTLLQLLPHMEIGIDEDDFSFSPVDVGKSSANLPPHEEMEQHSSVCFELFTATKSSEAKGEEILTDEGTTDNVDAKSPSPASNKDAIISAAVEPETMGTYSKPPQSQKANRPPKASNDSTYITEGDKGGGLGSGYVRGLGDKSMASSVHVELGFGIIGDDPPLDDELSSEKEEESLLGVTVVGSKRRKKKSSSLRTTCETVEEKSKYGLKEDESVASMEDGGDDHRRDPSPVAFEPTTKDAPPERKQLDPDGIVWKDIDTAKPEAHSTEPTSPRGSEKKTIDDDPENIDIDQVWVCPDNIFSPRNNNVPPVTPRKTPQTKDGQWNPCNHFTPRSKLLTTPRATPRTVRAANLSSNQKFGFGLEDNSPDTSFKMNEKPFTRRDNKGADISDEPSKGTLNGRSKIHTPNKESAQQNAENGTPRSNFRQSSGNHRSSEIDSNIGGKESVDGDEREAEQIEDQNEGRSPKSFNKHTVIKNMRSKFESNTFGIDHLQKSLQNIRDEKAEAFQSPIKTSLLDSPIEESNTPSKIYLVDRDLRAMSSLETETQASIDDTLNKGVSEDNEATIGDSTLDGTMDTKKALRYARKLEKLSASEDNSKENHEEEVTSSIVALRRKAFENQTSECIKQKAPGRQHILEKDKGGSLASQRFLLNTSIIDEPKSREETRQVQNYSSVTPNEGGKTGVVASIKERIAAYDGQHSKKYRLSSQSKTFQARVGGQVKNINIQNSSGRRSMNDMASLQKANPVTNTSWYLQQPSWVMNENKQLSAPAGIKIQHGGTYSSQATGSQYHKSMSRITPIDTRYESHTPDDDDDGITLSPTISEVSGLTLPTCLTGVAPVPDVNGYERSMTPIGSLGQNIHQANRFSYGHIDAPTPRTSMETSCQIYHQQGSSRRDQIVSRIRKTSSNGNLWQRRNIITEVPRSTSADISSFSHEATISYPFSKPAVQGMVAEKVAKIDRPTGVKRSGERVNANMSVVERVAMMNRHSQQHTKRSAMGRATYEPSSSLETRDCIRVD